MSTNWQFGKTDGWLCSWRYAAQYLQHVPDQPGQEEEGGPPGDPQQQGEGGDETHDRHYDAAQQNYDHYVILFGFTLFSLKEFIKAVDLQSVNIYENAFVILLLTSITVPEVRSSSPSYRSHITEEAVIETR